MFMIDLLYTGNCEGLNNAKENLITALNELGFDQKQYLLTIKEIKTEKEAKLWKLAGSPTIKVNGVDIIEDVKKYGLFKRLYEDIDRKVSYPPLHTIKRALQMDIRERAGIREAKRKKKLAKNGSKKRTVKV